jgi:Domain of unknown function (DUF5668)
MSTVALFCRNCGKALNDGEKAAASIYCGLCAPQFVAQPPPGTSSAGASPAASPPTMAPVADPSISPGLAFLLGLIPGVGAIYNGQYAKGLVHVFIFGLLMSIASEGRHEPTPLIVMMMMGFYFYMPFEAYHTAVKRQRGLPVDEFSSILPLKGKAGLYPVGPIVMIGVGILFLLNNFELLRISQVLRLWPMGLIALGFFMLRERLRSQSPPPQPPPGPPTFYSPYGDNREVPHE